MLMPHPLAMRAIITVAIDFETFEAIEKIRKEKDISRSAAARYLMQKGIENEGGR